MISTSRVAAERNEEVKIMEMTWSQTLRAEGRVEGREEGREEGLEMGRLEGMRSLVQGLLERRFGPLSATTRGKIEGMTDAYELSGLAIRVLDARSLEDLGL